MTHHHYNVYLTFVSRLVARWQRFCILCVYQVVFSLVGNACLLSQVSVPGKLFLLVPTPLLPLSWFASLFLSSCCFSIVYVACQLILCTDFRILTPSSTVYENQQSAFQIATITCQGLKCDSCFSRQHQWFPQNTLSVDVDHPLEGTGNPSFLVICVYYQYLIYYSHSYCHLTSCIYYYMLSLTAQFAIAYCCRFFWLMVVFSCCLPPCPGIPPGKMGRSSSSSSLLLRLSRRVRLYAYTVCFSSRSLPVADQRQTQPRANCFQIIHLSAVHRAQPMWI